MGIADRRHREREARREQILEAAGAVFREAGFAEASLERIAERAEISRGTIYFHFRCHEELVGELMCQGIGRLVERMTDIVRSPGRGADRLRQMAEVYYDFFTDNPEQLAMAAATQTGALMERWGAELRDRYFRAAFEGVKVLAQVIEKGVHSGEFRDLDALSTARLLWAASFGFVASEGRPRPQGPRLDTQRLRKTIELGYDLIMNGMLKPAA